MDFSLTPEQLMFQEAIGRFAREKLEPYVKGMEATDRFPVEVFKLLGELGYLGVHFPVEYGGLEIELARLMIHKAAWLLERKEKFVKEAAMAKLFASEMANRAAHRAIQIQGGYGYAKEHPLERYYRDARLFEIFQGTSEILRVIIAGQLGL